MPEYLSPGVYVEEFEMGPKPIEGVGTSTAGFLGETERGPTEPRLLTSFADFERTYGGFEMYKEGKSLADTYLAYAVDGFFRNGGKRCYLGRVTADERTAAVALDSTSSANELIASPAAMDFGDVVDTTEAAQTFTLTNNGDPYADDPVITITDWTLTETDGSDASGGPFTVALDTPVSLGPGESTEFEVTFTANGAAPTVNLDFQPTDATVTTPTVTLDGDGVAAADNTLTVAPATLNFGDQVVGYTRTRTVTLRNLGDPDPTAGHQSISIPQTGVIITDAGGGSDDPNAYHVVVPGPIDLAPGESAELDVSFTPGAVDAFNDAELDILGGSHTVAFQGSGIDGTDALTATAVGPGSWGESVSLTVEPAGKDKADLFKLTVRYWSEAAAAGPGDARRAALSGAPDREEVYDNLSAAESSPNYYRDRVNAASTLVEVEVESTMRPLDGTRFLSFPSGGSAPDPNASMLPHYMGDATAPPGERTGLAGFADVDEINFVVAPDEGSVDGLTDALVTHCETMGDRFAVLQAEENDARPGNLRPPTDSSYAAFYYPWIEILDPATSVEKLVPPGGHVAGIYARSDVERGVHKAPANEVIRGVRELQFPISKGEQEVLNPRGVNCIRSFPGRGIRLWGARTMSSDPIWTYVNVRRLFLYLEESIDEGTQWVVFEPNNEKLWARVRDSISNFLTTAWRDGALMGTTPDEAFFVKCDRSTMTQDDIDNGRLIAVVGVAPVKPAEFVIIRIAQWTGGAEGA
jgi:phage tail sheath protein FI